MRVNEMGFNNVQADYVLNSETACLIVEEFGFTPHVVQYDQTELHPRTDTDPSLLKLRPPVVTIMGILFFI